MRRTSLLLQYRLIAYLFILHQNAAKFNGFPLPEFCHAREFPVNP